MEKNEKRRREKHKNGREPDALPPRLRGRRGTRGCEKRDTGHLKIASEGRSKHVVQALPCVRILDRAACVFHDFREVDARTGLRSAVAIDRGDLRIRVGADHVAAALPSRFLGTARKRQASVIYLSI